MRKRGYYLKKARKTNTPEEWSNYRCLRNEVTNKLRKAKHSYNMKLVENSKDDPKAFWKTVKKIVPGS